MKGWMEPDTDTIHDGKFTGLNRQGARRWAEQGVAARPVDRSE